MHPAKEARSYFEHKYGKPVTPFVASFDFQADELKYDKDENGCKNFYCKYNYSISNQELNMDKQERHANFRYLKVMDPSYYTGKFTQK